MSWQLVALQKSDDKAQQIRAERLKIAYKEVDGVLYHQGLFFVLETIWIELISWHYDELLAGHFGISKIRELIDRKYYWLSFRKDVKAYIKDCNICLGLKAIRYKPYGDLQSLPIPTHW